MTLFQWLFGPKHKDVAVLQKDASGSYEGLDYELNLLDECKRKRNIYIERLATLKIEDIDRTIAEYEDQVKACSKERFLVFRIIEEKLSQLKKAREIVEKKIMMTSFLPASPNRFDPTLQL
jgi:hypothetical protein